MPEPLATIKLQQSAAASCLVLVYLLLAPAAAAAPSPCGNGVCDKNETCSTCPQDCKQPSGKPCQRVGILYSVWHWPAYNAVQKMKQDGFQMATVEDVLRSRRVDASGVLSGFNLSQALPDIYTETAFFLFYQYTPRDGFYCIYEKRGPGDEHYAGPESEGTYNCSGFNISAPDCPNVTATLTRHAQQLVAAGVDYVAVDMTNLPESDNNGDALALRPFEVLVDTWAALRRQGIHTPDVAAWQRLPQLPVTDGPDFNGSDWNYPKVLDFYNVGAYGGVIMKDAYGKKIFFVPDTDDYDPAFVQQVQQNGGRNDITTVLMWVNNTSAGSWSFFSQCQSGVFLNDEPCLQAYTSNSTVGSQVAVSPSYQWGWSSLPWQAVGAFSGITLQKQFERVFAVQPDYVFISSWNEHLAQKVPAANNMQQPMGFEQDASAEGQGFVDLYGVEFSRDVEPSLENGSLIYDLLTSCLRVFRSGNLTCSNMTEPCCRGGNFSTSYGYVNGAEGTFGVFAPASPLSMANRTPLTLCSSGTNTWYASAKCSSASANASVAASGQVLSNQLPVGNISQTLVGYMGTSRSGGTLRTLLRCRSGTGSYLYSLTGACNPPASFDAMLGYVR